MTLQSEIYQSVADRGYMVIPGTGKTAAEDVSQPVPWRAEIMLGRQFTKLCEELGELGAALGPTETGVDFKIIKKAGKLGERARLDFRNTQIWLSVQRRFTRSSLNKADLAAIKGELADMQVVLGVMAEVVRRVDGSDFDITVAALAKAHADVKRGVSA